MLGNTPDKLNYPRGIYVDANGVLYIVDRSNHRIQRWVPGNIHSPISLPFMLTLAFIVGAAVGTTIAGESTVAGAWSYQLNSPTTVMFDPYGSMYVMDAGNSRIQKWLPGMTYGMTVIAATMNSPFGMSFDLSGNIVIADTSNQRVVSYNTFCGTFSVVGNPISFVSSF